MLRIFSRRAGMVLWVVLRGSSAIAQTNGSQKPAEDTATPLKTGLWETRVMNTMSGPGLSVTPSGSRGVLMRACLTAESKARFLTGTPPANAACPRTNLKQVGATTSFDVVCGKATSHTEMTRLPDSTRTVVHTETQQNGQPLTIESVTEARFIDSDCGTVKPESPQVIPQ